METGDGDAGAAEDAMPEAGNGGAGRTRPRGGDFGSREVALCVDCAPSCLVSMGGPAPLGGAGGGRRPVPELPRSEMWAAGVEVRGAEETRPGGWVICVGRGAGAADRPGSVRPGVGHPAAPGAERGGSCALRGGWGRRRTLPRSALRGALSVPRVKARRRGGPAFKGRRPSRSPVTLPGTRTVRVRTVAPGEGLCLRSESVSESLIRHASRINEKRLVLK